MSRAALVTLSGLVVLWIVVWLGLDTARRSVLAALDTPAARQEWQAWKQATQPDAQKSLPVARRAVKVDEPPALILFRDHFGAIVGSTLVLATALYGFLAVVVRGLWRGPAKETQPTGA